MQGGRALAPGVWAPDLHAQIVAQLAGIRQQRAGAATEELVCARLDGVLAGIAFLSYGGTVRRFGVLDDLLVAPAMRGHGIGRRMLTWIAAHLKNRGVQRLFLESGGGNAHAHHFFETQGFQQVSIVMLREL